MLPSLAALQQPPFYHEMILVEGGTFMMGSDDKDAFHEEKPVHEVLVGSFQLAKYPVTQSFWEKVMGNNPSHFKGDDRPVERVSWDDAHIFIQKIKEKTGIEYRLPTEAEWEYAARGGIKSKGYKYAGSDQLTDVGWYQDNSHDKTEPVGLKHPNELGLYDMSGNVWEWCQDWYSGYYYGECQKKGLVLDPQGPEEGSNHVFRGGAVRYPPQRCRPTYRFYGLPGARFGNVGFRLAASAPPPVQ